MKTIQIMKGAIIAITFLLLSCEKKSSDLSADKLAAEKISKVADDKPLLADENLKLYNLVEKMQRDTDDDKFIEGVITEYRALDKAGLDAYNVIRGNYELTKLNESVHKDNSKITQDQYYILQNNIKLLTELRVEANKLAIERFGKTSANLQFEQLNPILEQLFKTKYSNIVSEQKISPLACTIRTFPSDATKTDGNGVDDLSYLEVTKAGQSDCDWQFNYSGIRTR
ncbi:hypothetical protein HDC92_004928, partial [Pedobacter sp. AK017]|uniref:hypothetical protein n=1 Tax=Pedobacter sp. AK017 TaxID=2723073 RepID=UPI0016157AEA